MHAAVALHVPDLLADGPLSAAEVAERTGLDPDRARRLLRGLVALGVVSEVEGKYANTEVGDVFREGVRESRRALAMMHFPHSYRAWEHFVETLRTGATGHSLAYGGTLWDTIAADPDFALRFNESMAANSRAAGMFLASAGNFAGAGTVVDVGGGKGALLAAVLRVHLQVRGIVCDLAVGLTEARAYLAEQGSALNEYATFCALAERFDSGWHSWPVAYRRPDAPGARRLSQDREFAGSEHD